MKKLFFTLDKQYCLYRCFRKVGLSLILNSIVKKNGITKNLEILLKSRFCYQTCYKFHGKTKAMKGGES